MPCGPPPPTSIGYLLSPKGPAVLMNIKTGPDTEKDPFYFSPIQTSICFKCPPPPPPSMPPTRHLCTYCTVLEGGTCTPSRWLLGVCEGERDGGAGKGAKHQSRLLIDIIGSLERRGRGTCLPSVRKNLLHCDIS